MALWHCYNCNTSFEAPTPVCVCGADSRIPEMVHLVVTREVIHYCPPHPIIKDRSTRVRACDGASYAKANPTDEGIPWMFTASKGAATCPACLAAIELASATQPSERATNGD
jgi:hypothetical protein